VLWILLELIPTVAHSVVVMRETNKDTFSFHSVGKRLIKL
jgi:hypothetical protein